MAHLVIDVGMAVLRLTSERWMTDERADFARLLTASAADLRAITADSAPDPSARDRPATTTRER